MGNIGQDMDIFGDIFNGQSSEQDVDKKESTENNEADVQTAGEKGEEAKGTEISKEVLENKTEPTENDMNLNEDEIKEDESKEIENIGETDDILDELTKSLEEDISKVDEGTADAKEVLDQTLSDLQKANLRIKELEEETKVYQDKYLEKFGETSEMNLMKPIVETVKNDPELFILVKSYKSDNGDGKINALTQLLEKETGINISKYLEDSGKGAMSSVTNSGSETNMQVKKDNVFIPDNKVNPDDELF